VAVPHVVGAKLPVYINGGIFVIVFVSLSLLVWTSGQMSLCHAALAALGASTFAHLSTGLGLPWFVAFVGAGLAVIPLGALVAVPAIRLSGVYLALATFGFGILTQRVLYGTGFMFGAVDLRRAPRPGFARGDVAFYYLVVALAAAMCLLVTVVLRTRLGRLLRALGDSPRAMSTIGLSVNVTRLLVFCLSAFLAGTAGALFMAATGQGGGRGFPAINSLLWLTVLVVCGSKVVWSSAGAAVLLAVAPSYLPSDLVQHQAMIFGVVATVAAVVAAGGKRSAPTGLDRHERNPVQARLGEAALDGLAPTPALRRIRVALAAGRP
jgi:ABC-type branched-subunit amino acid transport system permease subunit